MHIFEILTDTVGAPYRSSPLSFHFTLIVPTFRSQIAPYRFKFLTKFSKVPMNDKVPLTVIYIKQNYYYFRRKINILQQVIRTNRILRQGDFGASS